MCEREIERDRLYSTLKKAQTKLYKLDNINKEGNINFLISNKILFHSCQIYTILNYYACSKSSCKAHIPYKQTNAHCNPDTYMNRCKNMHAVNTCTHAHTHASARAHTHMHEYRHMCMHTQAGTECIKQQQKDPSSSG